MFSGHSGRLHCHSLDVDGFVEDETCRRTAKEGLGKEIAVLVHIPSSGLVHPV